MNISKQCLLSLLGGYSFVFYKHLQKSYVDKDYFIENTSFHFNNELKFVYVYKHSKSGLIKDVYELNTLSIYIDDDCVLSLLNNSHITHTLSSDIERDSIKPISDSKVKDVFMNFNDILLKMGSERWVLKL